VVLDAQSLRVKTERYGVVCVLAVCGDLDVVTAAGFTARAAAAVDSGTGRLVLDLSGLRFADCCGARALTAVTSAVRAGCPVVVRGMCPAVARVLDLLGVNLTGWAGGSGTVPESWLAESYLRAGAGNAAVAHSATGRLVRQVMTARTQSELVMADSRRMAAVIAGTEDRMAATLARAAERRPVHAARLRQLSADAQAEAVYLRHLAGSGDRRAARPAPATGRKASRQVMAGPLRAWVAREESAAVVILSGEADMRSSGELVDLLVSQASGTRQLVVDAAGLSFADTATMRALVMAAKVLRERGGSLVLRRPRHTVAHVLALLGADQLIVTEPDR
jgi:anti-sigma B factor antagonist